LNFYRYSYHTTGSSPRMWGTPHQGAGLEKVCWFIPTHVGNSSLSIQTMSLPSVHPHACGELATKLFFRCCPFGSSPRMWGTPSRYCFSSRPRWFIPTHVGNSIYDHGTEIAYQVHPHACGELTLWSSSMSSFNGSSPRMWGTHNRLCNEVPTSRFIPTHVGNSKV